MRMPNWSRFNAVIVTRHSDVVLYGKCATFLAHIPYPRIVIKNPRPDEYMDRMFKDFESYDWIINVDDDAFLWNPARLWALMAHMERTGHHYCGMSDGLTFTPREWGNPASMNPYFNVFHMSAIRELCEPMPLVEAMRTKIPWSSLEGQLRGLGTGAPTHQDLAGLPFHLEPFYPHFFKLLQMCKPLYLKGESYTCTAPITEEHIRNTNIPMAQKEGVLFADDPITTILYDHESVPFLYHTWYARCYSDPGSIHKARIDRVARAAEEAFREVAASTTRSRTSESPLSSSPSSWGCPSPR
jgi:hypothetical protein